MFYTVFDITFDSTDLLQSMTEEICQKFAGERIQSSGRNATFSFATETEEQGNEKHDELVIYLDHAPGVEKYRPH